MNSANIRWNPGKTTLRWSSFIPLFLAFFINLDAGSWSVNASFQLTEGNYVFKANTTAYYFYGGLSYRTQRWNISASLPTVLQNSDRVNQSGGMFFPADPSHHERGTSASMHHGSPLHTSGRGSDYVTGLGDLNLTAESLILPEISWLPSVSLTSRIKFPTANQNKYFGTGEYDYGLGLTIRKRIGNYATFLDAGYLIIGDSEEEMYKDPFTYGVGMGRFLSHGKISALVYFQGYSSIFTQYRPPRQISLTIFFILNNHTNLSLIGLTGLTETSPDVSIMTGIEWRI